MLEQETSNQMPEDHEDIIEIEGLVKRFGDQTVLNGINLTIHPGETMVIMGGSGSEQSTLLRNMIGTFTPEEAKLFGKDLATLDEEGMNEVRKQFGILFQSGALFQSLTVAENVALPLEEHTDLDANIIDFMVKIKLELVGLRDATDKYPAQISGGMKKRADSHGPCGIPRSCSTTSPVRGRSRHLRRHRPVDGRPDPQAGCGEHRRDPRDGFRLHRRSHACCTRGG